MEKDSEKAVSGFSKIPFMATSWKELNDCKFRNGVDAYRPSTDLSLFSTSLPVIRHEKIKLNETGQSSTCLEDDFKNPLEDLDLSSIGSILPGNEDDLLSGLMDDFDFSRLPTQLEDFEDDIFRSGGGLEIETENRENFVNGNISYYNGGGTVSGEHPYGEHPSRTLFVRNINSNVEDNELKALFEQFGDIRTLYTACKHRGFVMISYYDIRAARTAMKAMQNKPLRRRKLDIHFSIPKDNPSEKDVNQGTLVIFNLDASVSNDELRQIFGAYGEVKEIRETPHKRHHKFIEFYDVRHADAALKALNRSDIAGKRIKLEPSRPGGARRSLFQQLSLEQDQDEFLLFRHQIGSPIANSPPGNWPKFGSPIEPLHPYGSTPKVGSISPGGRNNMSGLTSILPFSPSDSVKIAPIGKDPRRISPVINKANTTPMDTSLHPYSLHDPALSSSYEPVSPNLSSDGTLSGPQFLWGSPTIQSDSNSSLWSSSSSKARQFPSNGNGSGFSLGSQHGSFLGSHRHIGSAPSGIHLEKHLGLFSESPELSYTSHNAFHFGRSYGNHGSPGSRMLPVPKIGLPYFETGPFGGMRAIFNDGLIDRARGLRAENGSHLDSKRQYHIDLDKILNGEDARTTLMIKNIPNKYTSKMLLAAIDETHKGTYDFLYLPIDFKNKCNVGYAFINMVSPSHIVTFHEVFNGKKWEKFNSEKVASLAYARIQGKAGLVSHFQNSSLMNEDKHCRPIIFQSEDNFTANLESYLSGNLNVLIRQADGSYTGDSLESPKSRPDEKR